MTLRWENFHIFKLLYKFRTFGLYRHIHWHWLNHTSSSKQDSGAKGPSFSRWRRTCDIRTERQSVSDKLDTGTGKTQKIPTLYSWDCTQQMEYGYSQRIWVATLSRMLVKIHDNLKVRPQSLTIKFTYPKFTFYGLSYWPQSRGHLSRFRLVGA